MLVVFLIVLFAMALAALVTSQYRLASRSAHNARAFEAAQAGLAQAIYQMSLDPDYGRSGERLTGSVSSQGDTYSVSFDPAGAEPWSVNNLRNPSSVPGYGGQAVPPYTARVIATGQVAGSSSFRRRIQAVLAFPAFPYALAASRQIRSGAGLRVQGAASLAEALAGRYDQEGNLYSGGDFPNSIHLGDGCLVSGRARTPGGVRLGLGSIVQGGVEEDIEPEDLPQLDITSFDNRDFEETVTQSPGSYALPQALNGSIRVPGDLALLSGGVLTSAYLYVDGDLTCSGPLTGTGTIFTTGRTELRGGANLLVNTGIAIFSQGDLEVQGGVAGTQYFQGLLYSLGDVRLRDRLTVLGSVLAAGPGGDIVLEQPSTIIYLAEYSQFGGYWSQNGMQGSLVNGQEPILEVLYWGEMP
ncbi:MAG TPA: hypothetical protein VNO81_13525 [Candidatus Nitrosotenuis sp.]|nr:hypothetical protein [Candidatus Nitrosotenuis sp.]